MLKLKTPFISTLSYLMPQFDMI